MREKNLGRKSHEYTIKYHLKVLGRVGSETETKY